MYSIGRFHWRCNIVYCLSQIQTNLLTWMTRGTGLRFDTWRLFFRTRSIGIGMRSNGWMLHIQRQSQRSPRLVGIQCKGIWKFPSFVIVIPKEGYMRGRGGHFGCHSKHVRDRRIGTAIQHGFISQNFAQNIHKRGFVVRGGGKEEQGRTQCGFGKDFGHQRIVSLHRLRTGFPS
jgi:hypothetical protein